MRSALRHAVHAAAAFAACALAACGGGSSSAPISQTYVPPLAGACKPADGGSVELLSPYNSQQNVATSLPQVAFAATGTLQSTAFALLVPNGASLTQGAIPFGYVTPVNAPPAGSATSTYGSPSYFSSASPGSTTLPTNTLVSVYFADSSTSCSPALLGSFITQSQ